MRRFWLFAGLALLACAGALAQQVNFRGQKLVRANFAGPAQLRLIDSLRLDVWSETIHPGDLDVRANPVQLAALRRNNVPYIVLIEDIQALIDSQKSEVTAQGMWDDYMDLATLQAQLVTWQNAYPEIAKVVTIGTSLEGRPITALKISSAIGDDRTMGNRKVATIFFAVEHAREWIGPPIVMYIANWLLTNYNVDSRATGIVNNTEVYICPAYNVDGYLYTWTTNRMWRKNRRNNGGGNWGVDVNRNWDYQWGGPGSSGDPASETYRGPTPASEPETQALANFELAHPNIKGHIDYHSYSQLIMYPWGYTSALCPDNSIYNYETGRMATIIARPYGTSYAFGPIYNTIYPASGTSVDWSYAVGKTKAITIELRDTGTYGFLLPKEQILPTCTENLEPAIDYLLWVQSVHKEPLRKK